ncbi:Patatin-like phospholipase domain-containing protein 7 [Orchesella cincta]|uniref:Patatin-like phospholipase domain-containing protein 7 n=1 Tax=Orchesella cincta TaxID=48709 RepID=A0A1D2NP00_ORCCI|nr:Patatin-like phospholipase domain-containing protein 7 [Orchesella cincta]
MTGILGYSNTLFCRAVERSIVVSISRHGLETLFKKHPLSIFPVAFMTVYRMSCFTRAVDFAMEWMVAKVGQYIYHKEQMCHNSYLLLSGHARAYKLDTETTRQRAVLEYKVFYYVQENDWIGLTESLLLSKRRSKTCVVVRESEFVTIPNDLLRNIVINYSSAAQIMLNFLVQRTYHSRKFETLDMDVQIHEESTYKESRRTYSIALVPVAEGLPYSVLAVEIKRHYQSWGTCSILTYKKLLADIQQDEITEKDQFRLEMYTLAQLEANDLVIFICLPRVHYWNEICSKYSEVVFTICCSHLPNIPTAPPEWEETIIGKSISTRRKELIILHSMDVVLPRNTKEWLYCRDWLHFHHHIRLPNEAFTFLGAIPEDQIESRYKCLNREITLTSDMSRLLRWLLGKTFGVLFSSGGARIGTQLGMLQALIEYKMIPIDMVVGTGGGFLLAVLYAIYQDYDTVQKIIEKIFKDFKDLLSFHWDDFSIPYISSNKGKRLLVYFYQLFGSIQLEDTFLPVCCVTTNLTSQNVRVERSGPIWVFVRASLTHTNHSPPICDPIDGDYIGDGAHANSLPEDVLKEFGAEYIIAFNTVGSKILDNNIADPNMSFFRYIIKAGENFLKQCGLANPSFEDVFNKLAVTQTRMYAAGVESISNLKYAIYVRPPTEHIFSQQWDHLPTLHRIGYFYMQTILDRNPYTEDIPFCQFWIKMKNTSTELAKEGGRELQLFN